MTQELPQGWAYAELQDVCTKIQDGTHFSPQEQSSVGKYKYITAKNIKAWGIDLANVTYVGEEVHRTIFTRCNPEKGDVLYIKDGATTGIATVNNLEEEFSLLSSVALLKPNGSVLDPHFLKWYLNSPVGFKAMTDQMTGSAITRLVLRTIRSSPIPVAPLHEQQRIVAKLEVLLGKVDACRKRLEKIPAILKRFRQSVLAAACSGRLTTDWREDDSFDDDLPSGWKRIPLADLLPPGGIFDGPFGSNLKSSDYTPSGVRVIRLENIGHLRFKGEKETYISHEKFVSLKKHSVGEEDIVFASFIDEEIRACLLPKLKTAAIAKADCFCLRPSQKLVDRKYLTLQLVSRETYDTLFENIHGATRPRINTTQLRKLSVRVCPLPEQREIVRRVEALFALADQIETRYAKAKTHVDRLTQSILAQAFRGALVPQDPNDEPASALLERIRSQRQEEGVAGTEPMRRKDVTAKAGTAGIR